MEIKKIYEREQGNDRIILYKEGIFWKAYEVSAYLFVHHIKPYDARVRYYKNIKCDVVYMGFPASYMDVIRSICNDKGYEIQEHDANSVSIQCCEDQNEFLTWKDNMIRPKQSADEANAETILKDNIIQEIVMYPLAIKTPIEAQQFLYDIQKRINGDL